MKRRLLMILLLLVAGAIVNVAVAWGCAWWWPPFTQQYLKKSPTAHQVYTTDQVGQFSGRHYRVEVLRNRGGVSIHCSDQGLVTYDDFQRDTANQIQRGKLVAQQPVPSWSTAAILVQTGMPAPVRTREDASGWPLLSMRCYFVEPKPPSTARANVLHDGLSVPDYVFPGGAKRARALPLRLILPGFAINTVFYAVVLWLLFAATFALRKRRRIKRGLCPKCAYDLRNRPADSSFCPECGATHAVTVSGTRTGEESQLV